MNNLLAFKTVILSVAKNPDYANKPLDSSSRIKLWTQNDEGAEFNAKK